MSEEGCIPQTWPTLTSLFSDLLVATHDSLIAEQQEIVNQHRLRGERPPRAATWTVKHQRYTRFATKNFWPTVVSILFGSDARREACRSLEIDGGNVKFYNFGNIVVSDVIDSAYKVAEGRSADIWSQTHIGLSLAKLRSAFEQGMPGEPPGDDEPISTSTSRARPAIEGMVDDQSNDDEYRFVMTLDPIQGGEGESGISWPTCTLHGDRDGTSADTISAVPRFSWVLAKELHDDGKTSGEGDQ